MPEQNNKLVKKILLSYTMTFIIIYLTDSLTMIADGMVVSRGLGPVALAAIGMSDPSYKMAILFSGTLALGLQSLCANAMGAGDKDRLDSTFSAGLTLTLAVSALLTVLGYCFTDSLCLLFGAGSDPGLYEQVSCYLRGWFVGIPGFILFRVFSPLVTLDGNKKCVTAATLVLSAVNIVGDILAVYVWKAGIYGVGFATGMANNLSACLLLLNFFRKHSAFRPFRVRSDYRMIPKMLHIGLPMITQQICRILAPIFINRTILSVGGNSAMSAMSVKSSILGFCVIVGNGVAASVGLLTQILYSEKDAVSLKHTVKTAFRVHLTLDLTLSALIFLFSGSISALYLPRSSAEWLLAVKAVRCLALSMPLNGCNQIIVNYLQSARKMAAVHIMTLFHRALALMISTVLLGKQFGTVGLFAAIPVSEAVVLAAYFLLVLLRGGSADFWDSLLMIPDEFGYNSDNSFSASISTVEEAVAVAERIKIFCLDRQVNRRTAYYSALCMEELAANIIQQGFSGDDKKHHCDIRVMIDADGVVLRLRDDCPYYNIRERFDDLAEDDIDAGVWIRLVFGLAKDVNYINIFNTNTLIIRM